MKVSRGLLISGLVVLSLTRCVPYYMTYEPDVSKADPPTVSVQDYAVGDPDPDNGYPYFSAVQQLTNGYIEEEYLLDGSAFDSNHPFDAKHPYKTRMIVRRPGDPAKFNGVVLLEFELAAHGGGLDALWLLSHDHIMNEGYTYISITADSMAVHEAGTGLRDWSKSRYGDLNVGEDEGLADNALAISIFLQAAGSVRNPEGDDPMGGLKATHVIAFGAAGAAKQLTTLYNQFRPPQGLDGFILSGGGGVVRTDVSGPPVFKVLTETEVPSQVPLRQPPSDHFQRWEIAGAAKFGDYLYQQVDFLWKRDRGSDLLLDCKDAPLSQIPGRYVINAAIEGMVRWIEDGERPKNALDIQVDPGTLKIDRDDDGNAVGGLRLPQIEEPIATNTGKNSPSPKNSAAKPDDFCYVVGTHVDFDAAKLESRYPTHKEYVAAVEAAAGVARDSGYIVAEDSASTVTAAKNSKIGKP